MSAPSVRRSMPPTATSAKPSDTRSHDAGSTGQRLCGAVPSNRTSRGVPRCFDIVQRDTTSESRDPRVWGSGGAPRRFTNVILSKSSTLTKTSPFEPGGDGNVRLPVSSPRVPRHHTKGGGQGENWLTVRQERKPEADQVLRRRKASQDGKGRPCFFWIGSSARRAFGGCLGSKRR